VIVVVKRAPDELLQAVRASGRPWFYDIVDAYPQPACSDWTKKQSIAWLKSHIDTLRPDGVIWPNRKMHDDADREGDVVYHHHRPGIRINPLREQVRRVGYEGAATYVEGWASLIERECKNRGWEFVINPEHLADVDIVLALRGGRYNGYPQRNWKSNVKLANAHGSGTPFIGLIEPGYTETAAGGEQWIEGATQLCDAFDFLTPHATRNSIAEGFLSHSICIDSIAEQVRGIVCAPKS
jgi:hypothetical protein